MGVLAGESFGELFVCNLDAKVIVLFLEELLGEETLNDCLCENIVAVIASLIAELLACLCQTLLVVLIFNCYTAGFSHGGGMAEVSAAGCEEVTQDKSEERNYDNDDQ